MSCLFSSGDGPRSGLGSGSGRPSSRITALLGHVSIFSAFLIELLVKPIIMLTDMRYQIENVFRFFHGLGITDLIAIYFSHKALYLFSS